MHKHQDGNKFTPPMKKLPSTSGLHGHGDEYTLAPNEVGHTHINKSTKNRTGRPVGPSTKIKEETMPSHTPQERIKREDEKTSGKKDAKKKAKKKKKKASGHRK